MNPVQLPDWLEKLLPEGAVEPFKIFFPWILAIFAGILGGIAGGRLANYFGKQANSAIWANAPWWAKAILGAIFGAICSYLLALLFALIALIVGFGSVPATVMAGIAAAIGAIVGAIGTVMGW